MQTTRSITLLKGDKVSSEVDYRDYIPVNMSGVLRKTFDAAGYMLMQPGLTQYGTGIGIDRGGLWNERHEKHYRVSGNSLIEVDASGATTTLGTVSGLDTASLPYSFNTQAVIADGRMWLYSPSGGFVEVTDIDLGDPIDGVWIDGYYFLTDGEFLYHTDLASETSVDPLKYATSEFSPDPTLGVGRTTDNKAIAFNRYTTEYFVNKANENFAFTRLATRALNIGIVGTHCKAEMNDQWYILGSGKGETNAVWRLGVGSKEKISSRHIDKLIGEYTDSELSDVVMEARVDKDYGYIIIHLPNETLLYNANIGQAVGNDFAWSILKTDVLGNTPWRGKFGLYEPRLGQWVYGDKKDSTLGKLDETVATHYGELAEWELHTPFIYLDSMSIDELEIETIPGFNATDDATVFVSLTFNGLSFTSEWVQAYGTPSEYDKRFILRELGYVNDWVGIKLRGASTSRMAFGRAMIRYG